MNRRQILTMMAIFLTQPSWAQDEYPQRSIRFIVPYAAGGGPDVTARRLAPLLGAELKQSVYVDNKVGAGGMLAAEVAAHAAPDGYTILLGGSSHITQKILKPKLNFDPLTSFEPVSLISSGASILTVSNESPYQNIEALAEAIQKQPGKLAYASGGIGILSHLSAVTFLSHFKGNAVHVPYRGSVDIPTSLISKQTDFAFPAASTAMPLIKQGKLRALAVTSSKRLAQLPDTPTLAEWGKSESMVQEAWIGIWVPKGTPKPIINKLHAAIISASKNPEFLRSLELTGSMPAFSASPEEFKNFMNQEYVKYKKIMQSLNISLE